MLSLRPMTTLLEDKHAVIYGVGTLGAGVARTFARKGATVHLVARTRARLEAVASDVEAAGGTADVAVLDALDEEAVLEHAGSLGRIDISFNLVRRGDVHGTPLLEMAVDDFLRPISVGARANFVTARAAARQMVRQGSGVILMVSSGSGAVLKPSRSFDMGGTGPADAAQECFMRYLAAEVGPSGVRVATLWTAGVAYPEHMGPLSMLGRGPTVEQFAETAAFVASDRGDGITSSIVNVSSGVSAN
jgi:NAD(P)-dependent dehydrogenase (short-subunit alcohol dehydrogenase family)